MFELKNVEYARKSECEQRQYEMRKLDLELEVKKAEANKSVQVVQSSFEVGRNIKMVPLFCECDVDKYFAHFESCLVPKMAGRSWGSTSTVCSDGEDSGNVWNSF